MIDEVAVAGVRGERRGDLRAVRRADENRRRGIAVTQFLGTADPRQPRIARGDQRDLVAAAPERAEQRARARTQGRARIEGRGGLRQVERRGEHGGVVAVGERRGRRAEHDAFGDQAAVGQA